MREGTKRLFPTDFETFKAAMIDAANDNRLPVLLELSKPVYFTMRDLEDTFLDFSLETGLELSAMLNLDSETQAITLTMAVDRPDRNGLRRIPLQ